LTIFNEYHPIEQEKNNKPNHTELHIYILEQEQQTKENRDYS